MYKKLDDFLGVSTRNGESFVVRNGDMVVAGPFASSKDAIAYQKKMESGSLYQLDIPDDVMPKLLDWDKPLSEQSPEVQNTLREAEIANRSGQNLLQMDPTGQAIVSALGRDEGASEYLASLGIPGLRYLDGSSRSKGAGTYNYVIWDQKVLDRIALLERNGEKLDAIREADEMPFGSHKTASHSTAARSPRRR